MGCSASRLDTLLAKTIQDPSFSLSSHHSSFSSSSASTSSSSSAIPKSRSISAPLVHHPAIRKGDTHHLVSLTSTTYGSLFAVGKHPSASEGGGGADFLGLSSPDSVINTWELMEGLEEEADDELTHDFGNDLKHKSLDSCDFDDAQEKPTLGLGLNFPDSVKKLSESYVFVEMPQRSIEERELDSSLNSKPLWKLLSEESLLSKMDPNVASSYQKALLAKNLGYDSSSMIRKSVGLSPFVTRTTKSVGTSASVSKLCGDDNACEVAGCEGKVVLYYTSVRGIRKTYEDCSAVRLILRGCKVVVDEKDISMDSTYKKELQSALGSNALSLPQLFIGGRHVGGADEIKQLHETGELERLLYGFPIQDCWFVCESCGDARFVPCSNCYGSRKVFLEEEERTKRCPDCNENGLVRCPGCCS